MPKRLLTLLFLLVLLFPSVTPYSAAQVVPDTGSQTSPSSSVMFIENVGEFADDARFQVWGGPAGTMWLAEDAIWLTVVERSTDNVARSQADTLERFDPERRNVECENVQRKAANIKLSFVGANAHPRIESFDRLDTVVSYFIGNDSTKWRPDVPVWGGVRYVDLYPGVDLEVTSKGGQLVQLLAARTDADLSAVRLRVEGADAVTVEADALHLRTDAGEVALLLLLAEEPGGGAAVQARGAQAFDVVMPFAPALRNRLSASLTPQSNDLLYGTFLGGNSSAANAIAVDGAGNAYVAGGAGSSDFPTTSGAFDPSFNGEQDAFVVKLNPAGSGLVYATFLGGSGYDRGSAIAVDEAGNAYVTGRTDYGDFPTTPGAFDRTFGGGACGSGISCPDAFVVKLNPAGSRLAYATFLGGSDADHGNGIAVDGAGSAYVSGYAGSDGFPTTPDAFDPSYNGGYSDAFVVKLNPVGSGLLYATFLGGSSSNFEESEAIAVDGAGSAARMISEPAEITRQARVELAL